MGRKKTIDEIHYGPEPDENYQGNIHACFQWYSYMSKKEQLSGWLADWMKHNEYHSEYIDKVRKYSDHIPNSTASLARMELRQVPCITDPDFPEPPNLGGMTVEEKIKPLIDSIVKKINTTKEKRKYEPKKPFVSIQERIQNKANVLSGEIDYAIDCVLESTNMKSDFNTFAYLQDLKVSGPVALKIADIFRPNLAEVTEALDGTDPQLKEGYSFLTKPQLRKFKKFHEDIIESIEKYADGKSKRKPRKKKIYSAEQQSKNLKYKWSDADYQLTSLDPTMIVGSMEFWAFNTKTKEITRYLALDRGGIRIKGTTLQNFRGTTKKIGNKTDYSLDRIQKGGKIVLSKVMDEINTKSSIPTGRINQHPILLKVN